MTNILIIYLKIYLKKKQLKSKYLSRDSNPIRFESLDPSRFLFATFHSRKNNHEIRKTSEERSKKKKKERNKTRESSNPTQCNEFN